MGAIGSDPGQSLPAMSGTSGTLKRMQMNPAYEEFSGFVTNEGVSPESPDKSKALEVVSGRAHAIGPNPTTIGVMGDKHGPSSSDGWLSDERKKWLMVGAGLFLAIIAIVVAVVVSSGSGGGGTPVAEQQAATVTIDNRILAAYTGLSGTKQADARRAMSATVVQAMSMSVSVIESSAIMSSRRRATPKLVIEFAKTVTAEAVAVGRGSYQVAVAPGTIKLEITDSSGNLVSMVLTGAALTTSTVSDIAADATKDPSARAAKGAASAKINKANSLWDFLMTQPKDDDWRPFLEISSLPVVKVESFKGWYAWLWLASVVSAASTRHTNSNRMA